LYIIILYKYKYIYKKYQICSKIYDNFIKINVICETQNYDIVKPQKILIKVTNYMQKKLFLLILILEK
jgi:hypothetical protein